MYFFELNQNIEHLFDGDLLVFTFKDLCQFSLQVLEGKVRRQNSTAALLLLL